MSLRTFASHRKIVIDITATGIDAETVKKNLCEHNPGLKGCDKTLSGPPTAPDGKPADQGSCGN